MEWLIGRTSNLVTNSFYIIKFSSPGANYISINITQRFQNKVLRGIVKASCNIRNVDIHRDLNVNTVAEEIRFKAEAHYKRLNEHVIWRREISS